MVTKSSQKIITNNFFQVPECQFLCIKLKPEDGRNQLWWSREFQLAQKVELALTDDLNMNISDLKIDKWCQEESFLEYNTTDPPGKQLPYAL